MSWLTYLKSSLEIIITIIICCLIFYLFYTQTPNKAICLSILIIVCFFLIDGFLLRGTFFKVKEGFEDSFDLSEREKRLQNILKGYVNNENQDYLKIKNLKINGKINGQGFYDIFNYIYPVGTVLISEKDPFTIFHYGRWEPLNYKENDKGKVRFLRIKKKGDGHVDEDYKDYENVLLQEEEIPFHDHYLFNSQITSGRNHHKVFSRSKPSNKLYVNSITHNEALESGDEYFKSISKQFSEPTPHNNISPFVSFNIWERIK